jgi:hypothetical protein
MAMRVFLVFPRLTAALRATRPLSTAWRSTYPLVPGKAGSPYRSHDEVTRRPPGLHPDIPILASLRGDGKRRIERKNSPAHRIAPALHRLNFPGILGLGPCPFRCLDLRKMALGEQVRVSRFFKQPARPKGRFAASGTAILVYLFWNQSFSPGAEKRHPKLKFFPTFSLTGVIPEGRHRRSNNLWTTSRNILFLRSFFCCRDYGAVVRWETGGARWAHAGKG